ncbi:MAG: hypothetical protein ABF289_12835 [Clostridiales bacterium]
MKRDLKINYDIIDDKVQKIKNYLTALEDMKNSYTNILNILENSESETIDELKKLVEKLKVDIKSCYGELKDLRSILTGYSRDMQAIIKPVNKKKMMRVSRNDIYWNLRSVKNAALYINGNNLLDKITRNYGLVGTNYSAIGNTEVEKAKKNYTTIQKIIKEEIPVYSRKINGKINELDRTYKKVITYENKDDEYKVKADKLYDKYTDSMELLIDTLESIDKFLGDVIDAIIDTLKDLVLGIVGLVFGLLKLEVSVYVAIFTAPFGVTPKWATETIDSTGEMVYSILNDPFILVEGLAQGASDTIEEKGIVYGVSYVGTNVAIDILLTKGAGKYSKLNKVSKGLENADDIADLSKVDDIDILKSSQKKIDDYVNEDLEKILSTEKKNLRLDDSVELQSHDEYITELRKKGEKNPENITGYNDGKKSYIDMGGPNPEETLIHEHVHQLSANDTNNMLKRGIATLDDSSNYKWKNKEVNEALTEYYTKNIMRKEYPVEPATAYVNNMKRIERMEEVFGKDIYKESYFQNKPELIIDKYENVIGKGKWEKISKAFDDSLDFENLTKRKRNKADKLANKLVDKFINKSTKKGWFW